MQFEFLDLTVRETAVRIACLRRRGPLAPLVCLHGFGSTKEDYADLAFREDFEDRGLVMLDAPGFGESSVAQATALSIPFLVDVALAACDRLGLDRFHLSGHSMGGLTALLLASANPERVLSLIDIEGNLAPEDCFLSRQIVEHPTDDADEFLAAFIDRVSQRPEYSSRLYTSALRAKVRATSARPVFASMVELSDNRPLLEDIAALPCPRMFIHGEQNRHLSYLPTLPGLGVEVTEIKHAAHFPMYSNPPALWSAMANFISTSEAA